MASTAASGKIEHVVILMLENRSFDHLMGYFPGASGLRGDEYNLLDPTAPESVSNPRFAVGRDAPWRIADGQGPSHSLEAVNVQLSGSKRGPTSADAARNNGFALSYRD